MKAFRFWGIVAMIVMVTMLTIAYAQEIHEYSHGMVPPTPEEEADIAQWIPIQCCRSNKCCFKVSPYALHPVSRDELVVVATGQNIKRTGWSRDGQTWRCACDLTDKGWKVHLRANTRCVFPAPVGF